MLRMSLLQSAKRDSIAKVRSAVHDEPEVQVALWSFKPALGKCFRDAVARANPNAPNDESGKMSMDLLLDDLFDRGIIRDHMVAPTPSVVGGVLPEVNLSLSLLDVKGCFVTAQKETSAGRAKAVIDFDEFLVCLALCGHIKYERVGKMSLAARVSAMAEGRTRIATLMDVRRLPLGLRPLVRAGRIH